MNLFKYLFGKGDPDDPMKGTVSDKTRARQRQRPLNRPWESAGHGTQGHATYKEKESLQSVKRRNSVAKWLVGLVIFGAVGTFIFNVIMEETGGTGYYEDAADTAPAALPGSKDMVAHNCQGFTVDSSVHAAARCYAYIRTYSPEKDALYAIDTDGTVLWKHDLNLSSSYGSLRMQVANSRLLVMGRKNLWVLDAKAGDLLWETELPNAVNTTETHEPMWVLQDTWLVLDEAKQFVAYDLNTGKQRWVHQTQANFYPTYFHVPLLQDGFAILDQVGPGADYGYKVLDARTGRQVRAPKPGLRYGPANQYERTLWTTSRVQLHPNGKHRFLFYSNIGSSAPAVVQQLGANLDRVEATYALPAKATQIFGATRYPWLMTPDWVFVETGSQLANADRFLVALNLKTKQRINLFQDTGYQYKALAFEQNRLLAYAFHNEKKTSVLMAVTYNPATDDWSIAWKHDLNGAALVKDGNYSGEAFGYWVNGMSIGIISSDKRLTVLDIADGKVLSNIELGGLVSMLKYMTPPTRFGNQMVMSVSGLHRLEVREGSAYLEPLVKDFRAK
jgi:outer membrane protein assembly factor BamB